MSISILMNTTCILNNNTRDITPFTIPYASEREVSLIRLTTPCGGWSTHVVVVVVVFTLKAVPVSTQYFLASVLVQLTRTPSVVTG